MDDGRTTVACPHYKLTYEPSAQVSLNDRGKWYWEWNVLSVTIIYTLLMFRTAQQDNAVDFIWTTGSLDFTDNVEVVPCGYIIRLRFLI